MPQACSHCRQAGHKRGKCPSYAAAASATAASDTATRTCSHCRQAGHTRRLCPTLQAERGCSNCSLLGHTISRCPERAEVRRRNNTNAQAAVRQRTLDAAHTTTLINTNPSAPQDAQGDATTPHWPTDKHNPLLFPDVRTIEEEKVDHYPAMHLWLHFPFVTFATHHTASGNSPHRIIALYAPADIVPVLCN